jgi:predicted component of type VI protein secretion system
LFCSPPPPVDPFVYRNEGIQIDLKADHMLNTFDGEAHSIKLGVYQLSNNAAFLERNITLKGCNELLKISKFDPTVVNYKQYIVNPSDSRLLIIDRAAGAKWIAVIAGYYTSHDSLPPSVLIEIPLITKRKTILRRLLEFTGLLTPVDARSVPATLIELILTPTTMYETSVFR